MRYMINRARDRLGAYLIYFGARVASQRYRDRFFRILTTGDPEEYIPLDEVIRE